MPMPPSDRVVPVQREPPRQAVEGADGRAAEVRAALAGVTDPELDESVVDLGFISRLAVEGDSATIEFRLPTFWCSANFAWIMAEDMREALAGLPWLRRKDIRLVDHFAADRINAGIAEGGGFAAAFEGEAAGDLTKLRDTFRRKAFLGRMSRLIEALRTAGRSGAEILAVSVADLRALATGAATAPSEEVGELAGLAQRYLALRGIYGGPATLADPAFRTADGEAIAASALGAWLRDIRMTRRGVEANGEMCRILLKGRYGESPAPAQPR
jgi:metal-sulfur cluster biosynthetic enzyme